MSAWDDRVLKSARSSAILIGHIAARASSCELSLDMGRRFCVDQGLHERRPIGEDEIGRDGANVLEEARARSFGGSGLGPELFECAASQRLAALRSQSFSAAPSWGAMNSGIIGKAMAW